MTRRNSTDPLVRECLDIYGINFLRVPRENADIGEVHLSVAGQILPPGQLESVVTGFELPNVVRGEAFVPAQRRLSSSLSLDSGFSLLGQLLSALGLGSWSLKAKATYQQKGAKAIRIKIEGATRDAVDVFGFANALSRAQLQTGWRESLEGRQIYATVGVVRSRKLLITAEDKNGYKVQADAVLANEASAHVNLSKSNDGDFSIEYRGSKPLAFGVELLELALFPPDFLRVKGIAPAVPIRTGEKKNEKEISESYKTLIGDPQGDIFVDMPSPP